MKKLTRKEELDRDASALGLYVCTYSPGDGVTRYRFFQLENGERHSSYFGPENGIYTALGLKEANTFLAGYNAKG